MANDTKNTNAPVQQPNDFAARREATKQHIEAQAQQYKDYFASPEFKTWAQEHGQEIKDNPKILRDHISEHFSALKKTPEAPAKPAAPAPRPAAQTHEQPAGQTLIEAFSSSTKNGDPVILKQREAAQKQWDDHVAKGGGNPLPLTTSNAVMRMNAHPTLHAHHASGTNAVQPSATGTSPAGHEVHEVPAGTLVVPSPGPTNAPAASTNGPARPPK